jgi:hypothetical protein
MWFTGNLIICLFLLLGLWGCQNEPERQKPSPPDLSGCTRIEILYFPWRLEHFLGVSLYSFGQEELDYLETIKVVVVVDEQTIKDFAHDVGQSIYIAPNMPRIANKIPTFNCFRDGEQIVKFHMISDLIETSEGCAFRFKSERTDWRKVIPPVWAMEMRVSCRDKIRYIRLFIKHLNDDGTYPEPDTWCDGIRKSLVAMNRPTDEITKVFKCLGAQKGDCSYAINPNCKPDSPQDTVLVFEARAGWNQHGGPELFSFDNHDPKGGFVILNDGTVKVIGTEEELKQLRWE